MALLVRVTVALPFLAVFWQMSAAAERVALARLPTKIFGAADERSVAVFILNVEML